MTRPQATTAILAVSNRTLEHRPAFVSTFSNRAPVAGKTWFSIKNKTNGEKAVLDVSIYDEIGGWGITAKEFVQNLMSQDADEIVVHVNSPGGDVFDGVAIYNALRMHSAPVTVIVEGMAASAASFIAQAGDEVIMLQGSMMMIHDASALAWGDEATMLETAEVLGKISNNIADIYAQRAGGKATVWRDIMREEMWYTADEAVSAKLADRVNDDDDAKATDKWDLSVYNYSGRADAPDPMERTLKITNKAQEATVEPKDMKNEGGQPGTEGTGAPAAPEAPATEPNEPTQDTTSDDEPASEGKSTVEPTTPTPVETPVPSAPVVPSEGGTAPTASATEHIKLPQAIMVNGQPVTDFAAVQRHITAMETARTEARDQARKDYITNLANNNKILASQVSSLEALVATMSDEQYDLWSASWDAAPNVPMLAAHGGGGTGTPSGTAAEAQANEIETLTDIVKNHLVGGMKTEKIETTESYKKLKALQPDFTLASLKK
jgi:ATP-dependent protease ClpP protease subunit